MIPASPPPEPRASEWRGILDADAHGERTRTAVEATVRAIADDLIRATVESPAALHGDLSLGRGAPGAALFLAYWGQYLADRAPRAADLACAASRHLLEQTLTTLASRPGPASLYQGYTGAAWAVQHVAATDDGDDPLAELDDGLARGLTGLGPCFDLVSGLAGALVYARERGANGRALLPATVTALAQLAQPGTPCGRTYFTTAAQLSPQSRPHSPDGHHDLGLAHGVPGVVAALVAVLEDDLASGPTHSDAATLVDDAIGWLLAQPIVAHPHGRFPAVLRPGAAPQPTRLAWCYGDLGIALTLVRAGRVRANPAWIEQGRALARLAAQRDPDTAGVVDASLCHGAAGLAQLFARLHAATGEPECRAAAQRWLDDALARRQPGTGVGGYRHPRGRDPGVREHAGFLEGASGIGLALLAMIDDTEPAWDRLLLLS